MYNVLGNAVGRTLLDSNLGFSQGETGCFPSHHLPPSFFLHLDHYFLHLLPLLSVSVAVKNPRPVVIPLCFLLSVSRHVSARYSIFLTLPHPLQSVEISR